MLHRIVLTIISLLCCLSLFAQNTSVAGRLTDKDGQPLSFGLVRVGEGTIGTTANDDGFYELNLEPGIYTISAEYMGYRTISKNVTVGSEKITENFKLADQLYSLSDVVISAKGEDPAIRKMRMVIGQRKKHADLVKTLETDIYLKGYIGLEGMPNSIMGKKLSDSDKVEVKVSLDMDTSNKAVIYLLEQQTHYYYQAPNKEYNRVQSVHTSGDPQGVGFATMLPITNIYDNNIDIASGLSARGFISPANANAFLYYDFKFEGSYFEDDGRMISRIRVLPKRKYEPCFSGIVYVVEDEWVFSSVDLLLTKESNINVVDTMALRQTYKPKAKDLWVIQSQNLYVAMSIFGFDFQGNFITNYTNQQLNQPLPADIFKGKIVSSYADSALTRPLSYWDSTRAIPLSVKEERDFVRKDSLRIINDSIRLAFEVKPRLSFGLSSLLLTGPSYRNGKLSIGLNSLISMVNFNHVEGLNLNFAPTLEYRIDKEHRLELRGKVRYGFSSQETYLKGGATYRQRSEKNTGKSSSISIDGGRFVSEITGLNPLPEFNNSVTSYFQGLNFLKLYQKSFVTARYHSELGNGFGFTVNGSFEDRTPLYNTTTQTYQNRYGAEVTSNMPERLPVMRAQRASILGAELRYQPGWKYIQYPGKLTPVSSNAPIFTIGYTKGIKGLLNSDADFDKWNFGIQDNFRMRLAGNVRFRAEFGGFLNKKFVGLPDYNHIIGNKNLLASEYLNSFQLAPYYRYSNVADLYGKLHLEWHLGGFLTNKIPLYRRLNWPLVAGTNSLYINKNDYYSEIFVGVENIGFKFVRILRVDFVAGYESGLAKPSFGIRLGLSGLLNSLSFGGLQPSGATYENF